MLISCTREGDANVGAPNPAAVGEFFFDAPTGGGDAKAHNDRKGCIGRDCIPFPWVKCIGRNCLRRSSCLAAQGAMKGLFVDDAAADADDEDDPAETVTARDVLKTTA